ncbi:MAG: Tol-Pal system protein TolB [Chlamydiales bacterium]
MSWFILCFFLLVSPSFVAEETITIHLSTQEELNPLYLYSLEDRNSGFDSSYLSQIEKILRFDLSYNGKTQIVKVDPPDDPFNHEKWKQRSIDYVVKWDISDRQLNLVAFSVRAAFAKKINGISLSGNLGKDRRLIHQVADAVHEAFFNEIGVANTRILYTLRSRKSTNSSDWVTEVWESDYDGANARQVTHDDTLCVTPTYVPPKQGGRCSHFLYVGYEVGQPKIYAASIEQGIGKRLTYLGGNQLMPTVSPRKDKIAFISDAFGNPDLFIQDFSLDRGLIGKPEKIFSVPQATQGSPAFSPDGKKLAFVSNKDGTPRIYLIEVAPSSKKRSVILISKKNRNNTSPVWSPDGTKIAYSASTNGVRQIWIYDITLDQEFQLTGGEGHKENPVWAPNSLHLMFNSSSPNSSELFLTNLNQKKAVQITRGPGEKRFPAWEFFDMKR